MNSSFPKIILVNFAVLAILNLVFTIAGQPLPNSFILGYLGGIVWVAAMFLLLSSRWMRRW